VYLGRYLTEEGLLPHGEPTGEDAHRAVAVADAMMRRTRAALEGSST
jgi:hypothetical protein